VRIDEENAQGTNYANFKKGKRTNERSKKERIAVETARYRANTAESPS